MFNAINLNSGNNNNHFRIRGLDALEIVNDSLNGSNVATRKCSNDNKLSSNSCHLIIIT